MSGSTHSPPPPPPPTGGSARPARGFDDDPERTRVQGPGTAVPGRPDDGTAYLPAVGVGGSQDTAPMAATTGVSRRASTRPAPASPPAGIGQAPRSTVPRPADPPQRWQPAPAPIAPQSVAPADDGQTPPRTAVRQPLEPRWWVAIVVVALLVVTAVLLGIRAFAGGGGETSQGATGAEATPTEGSGGDEAEPAFAGPIDLDGESFRSPSGNILCEISDDGARCDIANLASEPAAVDGCEGTIGYVVQVTGDGVVEPCVPAEQQPSAAPEQVPALDYGESTSEGDFECVSETSGTSCRDTETGAGFNVARAGITTF